MTITIGEIAAAKSEASRKANASRMERRHAEAIAKGRKPGAPGRPISSKHPRAEYWREWARKRREAK